MKTIFIYICIVFATLAINCDNSVKDETPVVNPPLVKSVDATTWTAHDEKSGYYRFSFNDEKIEAKWNSLYTHEDYRLISCCYCCDFDIYDNLEIFIRIDN